MAKAKVRVVKQTYGINATAPSTQSNKCPGIVHVHDDRLLKDLAKHGHGSVFYDADKEYQANTFSTAGYYGKFQHLAQQIDKCRRIYITSNDVTPSPTQTHQKSQAGTPTTNNGVGHETDKSVPSVPIDQPSQIQNDDDMLIPELHVQDDVQQQSSSVPLPYFASAGIDQRWLSR